MLYPLLWYTCFAAFRLRFIYFQLHYAYSDGSAVSDFGSKASRSKDRGVTYVPFMGKNL